MSAPVASLSRILICGVLVTASLVGFLATDLILPAIPDLPEILNGGVAEAQFVLAGFVAGNALGFLIFGAISWRFRRQHLLIFSMIVFGLVSLLATQVTDMTSLVVLRVFQGFFASAPAVIAPGVVRQLFSESGATRAIGALASLEALAPALGPIIGYWLLDLGGWAASFYVLAVIGVSMGLLILCLPGWIPRSKTEGRKGSYLSLLRSPTFLRYALSQALVVGGMIVVVMSAPAMIVRAMGGTMTHFITMQIAGVTCFILASNTTGFLVTRFGAERMLWFGSFLAIASALAIAALGFIEGVSPFWLAVCFAPLNAAVGFRGPPGFMRAIIAGGGQDDRASSLTILAIFIVISGGTALLAPVVEEGVTYVAGLVLCLQLGAALLLWWLPALKEGADQPSP